MSYRNPTPSPENTRAAAAKSERRPGEDVQDAINRLEDERSRLYQTHPRGWQERVATLNAALSGLWAQKRAVVAERSVQR